MEAAWYYHLGSRHLEVNEHDSALEHFNRALNLQSDHYKAWFGRGMALGNLERHKEALKSFDEALAVQSNASFGWHNYALLGFADLALDNLQRAVEFMPILYRELAVADSDLSCIWKQERFETLIRG